MATLIAQHSFGDIKDIMFKSYEEQNEIYEEGLNTIREFINTKPDCNGHKIGEGKLVGEVIGFSVADGGALYMIANENPLNLIHINWMDGYQIPEAHIRGLTLEDVRKMIPSDDLKPMF